MNRQIHERRRKEKLDLRAVHNIQSPDFPVIGKSFVTTITERPRGWGAHPGSLWQVQILLPRKILKGEYSNLTGPWGHVVQKAFDVIRRPVNI